MNRIFLLLNLVWCLGVSGMDDLVPMLKPIREKNDLPGLIATVVQGDKVLALGAVGVRKYGSDEPITVEDKFHIGSETKSMTATLIAMFVEQGKLNWKTKITDILPELEKSMHSDYLHVTLEQLLCHRSGIPEHSPPAAWSEAWQTIGTPREQRLRFIRKVLAEAPAAAPGSKHIYSNQNYSVAGAMLEQVADEDWEELIQRMLFKPLKMDSAGFGAPATFGMEDQPWGHREKNGKVESVPPGPGADNPPAIGPGGTVHCSIGDLARYVQFHLNGARGDCKLLKPESFKKLHTPELDPEYAMGWGVVDRPWGGGKVLTHNGSNTMFFTVIWIAPKKNIAFIVETNLGGDKAGKVCDETVAALIGKYLK